MISRQCRGDHDSHMRQSIAEFHSVASASVSVGLCEFDLQRLSKEALTQALTKLPYIERVVFSLLYVEGLTTDEVAAVLDRSEIEICIFHESGMSAMGLRPAG